MTVKELIEELKKLPENATVLREDGEYNGSTTSVRKIEYRASASLGIMPNTVIIR